MNEPLPCGEADLAFHWPEWWRRLILASVHQQPIGEEDSEISQPLFPQTPAKEGSKAINHLVVAGFLAAR